MADQGTAGIEVQALTEAQARDELARLAEVLAQANRAYHTEDAPEISDADYDALKLRNIAIEERFPELKREDSPSEQVGAPLAEGFAKVVADFRKLAVAIDQSRQCRRLCREHKAYLRAVEIERHSVYTP